MPLSTARSTSARIDEPTLATLAAICGASAFSKMRCDSSALAASASITISVTAPARRR
jgi:hypothetical protein